MIDRKPPWIIGHRGVAEEALENTLASLELAVAQDADMIELDVQLAGDGELIVFHDWNLERLAGRPEVVEESPASELRRLLPELSTLSEVLRRLPETMPLNVELKRRRADVGRLAEALERALGGRDRVLVSSFDWSLLEVVRRAMPDRALAPLAHEPKDDLLDVAERLGAWSVNCKAELATSDLLRRAARPVLVYTVNDAEEAAELFERGVAGVFTDAPGRLRRQLRARNP